MVGWATFNYTGIICSVTLTPSSIYLEFSEGLRTMIVPIRLLDRFLNIVRPNTLKKLETCGILAGILVNIPPK